jgi:hypothetical protein
MAAVTKKVELSDTILKWNYPRTIPAKFGLIWFSGFREEDLNVITKLNQTWQGWSLGGSLSKLCPTAPPSIQDGCILVGSRNHRTQFWKGAIQGPFHQSLAAIMTS